MKGQFFFQYLSIELFSFFTFSDLKNRRAPGHKRPALVDPSHKVRQGGMGSVWDGQTYGWTDGHFQSTSGPLQLHFRSLPVHFRFISSPFGHHRC